MPLFQKKHSLFSGRSRLALLLFLFAFSVTSSFSQYRIESWSIEQGLPYKTVNSVLQTRDGYLWVATLDGLARFDGLSFTVFNTASNPELITNRFGKLIESNDGSLWVVLDKRGLIRYKNEVFTHYTAANGLPGDLILSLHYFPDENVLRVGTPEGFAHFDGEKFVRDELPLLNNNENQTLIDNTGAIWTRFGNELRRTDGKKTETLVIPAFFSRSLLNVLYRDRSGTYWLTMDDVIDGYVVKFQGGKTEILSSKDGLPGRIISVVFEDSQDNIWFGSKNGGGLSIYQNGKFQHFSKKDGLSSDGFTAFFEDREGMIWLATMDGGLMRFSPQIIKVFSDKAGLSGKAVYPLFEDRAGTVWIGDWGNLKGLSKYENGEFSTVSGGTLFTSIFEDRDGILWVASYNQIGKIENGKYSVVYSLPLIATSAINQDKNGMLWFGSGDGLRRMKSVAKNRKNTTPLNPDPPELLDHFTTKDGLPADDIRLLHFDIQGTLWVATTEGLAKFDGEKFTVFTEADGLSGNYIRSIYEDSEGILWLGSYDNGLTRLKGGKFTAIRVKDGLFDQGVFQILEDDFGRFWISSNRGIYRVNRKDLNDFADGKINSVTSIGYGTKDGMADAECNGGMSPAGFKSKKDGTLWFPTQKGVAVVNPKSLVAAVHPPNVVIENCLVDGEDANCSNIKLLPDNRSLEINYAGLSFNKPEQIKFKYRLEGLDENWIDAGTRRKAYFTHLPPGKYYFRVLAVNVDGVWSETGAALNFEVEPSFYQTGWFWALFISVLIIILYYVYRWRTNFLHQRALTQERFSRQLLESQEQERQRIAIELHDSLGQDLLIIKNWAMLGLSQKSNVEKKDKQLNEISLTASQAIEEVRKIAYNLRPYHLDELGLTKAIESMCQRVSKASLIEFKYSFDDLDGFFQKNEEINFYRIVQECLNNIVKHSEATAAEILIECDSQKLYLEIKDNGKGFEIDKPKAYLENGQRHGLGLTSLVERSRILGGKLLVESNLKHGTKIILHLQKNAAGTIT